MMTPTSTPRGSFAAEAKKQFHRSRDARALKRAQRDYFLGLFSGRCDLAYTASIGIAHERVGVPPKWYLGAYARCLRSILDRLATELPDPAEARAAYQSVEELVAFDRRSQWIPISRSSKRSRAIKLRSASFRRQSSRLYHRVLLLPLMERSTPIPRNAPSLPPQRCAHRGDTYPVHQSKIAWRQAGGL